MSDFLAMGGYAQFVWGAFGMWFACVIFNIVSARRKLRVSLGYASIAAARQRHRQQRRMAKKSEAGI